MTWFNVLKFMTTRDFLSHFQKILGGEITGQAKKTKGTGYGTGKTSINFALNYPEGHIKVDTARDGLYHVKVNGATIASDYNLKLIVPILEKHLEELD